MNIGLLGMGTIGSGVFEILEKRSDIRVSRVLDLRDIAGLEGRLTRRFEDILEDPAIDTVVELLGGLEPAHTFAVRSMQAGKHFVTANKLMVSTHFSELMRVADEAGVEFRFSACVGGGIPYLYNLLRARRADRVLEVGGIVNGTTNLILDTMQSTGADFQEVLLQAQRMGYAEADPSADIDGLDARSKLAISMNLAFDVCIDPAAIPTAGIRHLHKGDVEAFAALGYACRFLTRAVRQEDGRLSAYVEPTLLPASAIEAAVGKNDNLISFTGEYAGVQKFFGQGAGKFPTGYAVVEDLIDILGPDRLPLCGRYAPTDLANHLVSQSYYLRTSAPLNVEAESLGENRYRTRPLPVGEMHSRAEEMRRADPELFFAGIRE